ncbi:MAG: LPXTG cell wall anchor domain-containing protein [Bacteroidia bacterium]|nr:LPXTG cell wall anchor domain-containing protein [Bacteroidia bacterium]
MKIFSILLIVFGAFVFLFSAMMKIMHWPLVNFFFFGGIALMGLGAYLIAKNKKKDKDN